MKEEIESACEFVCSNLRSNSYTTVTDEQIKTFRIVLKDLVVEKYTGHWYPDRPMRGNGYRCINIDKDTGSVDPMLEKAAEVSSISKDLVLSTFRTGLALWVDPGDVSYRTGRSSVITPLYKNAVMPNEKVKAIVSNNDYSNGVSKTTDAQNIFARYPQLTAKQLKQLLRQYEQFERFHWTNAKPIHKQVTEVY